jgi:IS30 family transposase
MAFGAWDVTENEVKKWATLYLDEDVPVREIAKRYNRAIPTVCRHLRIVGAYPKYKAKERKV